MTNEVRNFLVVSVNRKKTFLTRINKHIDDIYVNWSPSRRISFIWDLTKEIWSLKDKKSAQRRLQRNITNFKKTKS